MSNKEIILIYDKECPVCRNYSQVVRIRKEIGELKIVNAREDNEFMKLIAERGLNIDQGMVLIIGNEMYHGSDALHALAFMSSRSGLFNRLNYWIFRSKIISKLLYPSLKFGRNMFLKLLRKTKINVRKNLK